MQADTQAHVAFFLTGRRPLQGLDPIEGPGWRPALFAGYEDLTSLRYDFPIVLGQRVVSLSALFDAALDQVAQGDDADRVRRHGLRIEREIRVLAAGGADGMLLGLFDRVAGQLAPQMDEAFEDSCKRIRAALGGDGEVADCDGAMPQRLAQHLWSRSQEAKGVLFTERVRRLVLKLSAILEAEAERAPLAVSPDRLAATFGPGFAREFDFAAMSRLLARSRAPEPMPATRRKRIAELLRVLKGQRFFPDKASPGWSFAFESCTAALKAWHERQPKLVELARALLVAQLEVDGEYSEARHDAVFESYGAMGLQAEELGQFPDYLVSIDDEDLDAQEQAALLEAMSSGLPVKVLLTADDITGEPSPGTRTRQLASLAMGLNTAYVLQASASHLYQFRDAMARAIAFRGPALLNVYSGANAKASGLPPYLMAAAAMESRAFPAFTYDPSAGANWAARFHVEANPQPERDWPQRRFTYEDEQHQGVSSELAFTVVDFLAADPRNAVHLARVPREKWNGSLMPVEESLARERVAVPEQVPCVLMVDADNKLQKVIVDQALLRQASRCRDQWRSLQELGGIHNSHAEKLLALQQQQQPARREEPAPAQPAAAVSVPAPAQAAAPAEAEAPARNPDEAYIETERCSSCNECTQINNRMFAYNADQQAYIADINAGTYAQLVEAAESCQVAAIHPGRPRNTSEPGLEELVKRAEEFA